jgi:2'-hydroxyisoflavone reductase
VNILIIGGTRNLGHFLTLSLLSRGHRVTLLNRGLTRDDLPASIPRLRADRCDEAQLRQALAGREFDAAVDTALYRGREARQVVDVLDGRVGRFVFISTGQVYLVRTGVARPFHEEDYAGPLMAEPQASISDLKDWRYGIEKREAEDVLAEAWKRLRFPATSLRLPMVASERDHYSRIHGYLLRLRDGGPLLLPRPPWLGVRHVDVYDVVAAIETLLAGSAGLGQAYNVSPDETLTLGAFLDLLAGIACVPKRTVLVDRALLESRALLPDCSPMSDAWMSELDNARGRSELGLSYTRVAETLRRIVAHYDAHPVPPPASYGRRAEELALLEEHGLGRVQ